MAIKAVNSKKPIKKKRNTSQERIRKAVPSHSNSTAKITPVSKTYASGRRAPSRIAASRSTGKSMAKSVKHVKRQPTKGGSSGFLKNLFASDRTAGDMDYTFLLLVGVLVAFGLIMLLSASTPTADIKFGKSYYFFIRQFGYVAVGVVLMLVLSKIDYRKFKPFAKLFMIVCIVLLGCVFLPGIGVSHNGSHRWINLGITEIQPSEFTKLAVAMFYAALIEDRIYNLADLKDLVKSCVWIGIVAALMMCETHLSGTIVLCGIAGCVLLIGGAKIDWKILVFGGGSLVGLVWAYLSQNPERMARITSFRDPFADRLGDGYQVIQSIYAIGSGGFFGKGLGQSVQKFYIPEPYNDFIFAIVCEELGLIGAAFIIMLFAALILRGIKIAMEAPDTFGSLLVSGVMAQVAIQTVLNIAVATSSVPNTGVSLPFFSYGGTAIMILLAEMGIVMSVARYSSKNI